jgi:hypothetical protein
MFEERALQNKRRAVFGTLRGQKADKCRPAAKFDPQKFQMIKICPCRE